MRLSRLTGGKRARIFAFSPRTRSLGVGARVELVRGGKPVAQWVRAGFSGRSLYFDRLSPPVEVSSEDKLVVTTTYSTRGVSNRPTPASYNSTGELCIAYIYLFPAQVIAMSTCANYDGDASNSAVPC